MTAQPLLPLEALQSPVFATAVAHPSTQASSVAGDLFQRAFDALNAQLMDAEHSINRLAAGQAISTHDVMLQLEQARLSMQLATQVRSRVLEAYQDVMRMQV